MFFNIKISNYENFNYLIRNFIWIFNYNIINNNCYNNNNNYNNNNYNCNNYNNNKNDNNTYNNKKYNCNSYQHNNNNNKNYNNNNNNISLILNIQYKFYHISIIFILKLVCRINFYIIKIFMRIFENSILLKINKNKTYNLLL